MTITKTRVIAAAGIVALVLAVLASAAFGARVVGMHEVLEGLRGGTSSLGAIAVSERLPRTAVAVIAGAALAVSGALMQAVTRNPIADPGILGVNHGASLAVIIGIAFFGVSSLPHYIVLALIGSALAALLVYTIGSTGPGGTTPVKLALAGVATTAALSSAVQLIMLPRVQGLNDFRYWQVGSLGRSGWDVLTVVVPVLSAAFVVALLVARPLNSLALGDEMAVNLGVNVRTTRLVAAASGVVLCATTTAIAGPISFVGLMVPHAVRMLLGPDQRVLIPFSALGGAVLLTLADVLGRVAGRPGEVAVGIITAFVGAPILILIVRSAKVREL